MANYRKFDDIVAADGAENNGDGPRAEAEQRERQAAAHDRRAAIGAQKVGIDRWLKEKLRKIFPPEDPTGVPELDAWEEIPPRRVTEEERGALAMFMSAAHCGKDELNLANHHEIMEVARANRWLEEDPGTMELLCQLLRSLRSADQPMVTRSEDTRIEELLLCALNTLAAPPRAGCSDGYGKLYEFFALIGDPKSEKALAARAKYAKKEFAAEAIFDSFLPGRGASREEEPDGRPLLGFYEWFMIIVVVALVAFLVFLAWRSRHVVAPLPVLEPVVAGTAVAESGEL